MTISKESGIHSHSRRKTQEVFLRLQSCIFFHRSVAEPGREGFLRGASGHYQCLGSGLPHHSRNGSCRPRRGSYLLSGWCWHVMIHRQFLQDNRAVGNVPTANPFPMYNNTLLPFHQKAPFSRMHLLHPRPEGNTPWKYGNSALCSFYRSIINIPGGFFLQIHPF